MVTNPITGAISSIQETSPATILKQYTGEQTIAYTMYYLIKNGKGRVLANPKIMITNDNQHPINLVSDYCFKVDVTTVTTMATPVRSYNYTIASDTGFKLHYYHT